MINTQTIKKSIEQISSISRTQMAVYDTSGKPIFSTDEQMEGLSQAVSLFVCSQAQIQEVQGSCYLLVEEDQEPAYVLVVRGENDSALVFGKIAAAQLRDLIHAYRDRFDKDTFIQNLLLDNLLLVDIYNRARKLHIETDVRRMIYIVETKEAEDTAAMEILRSLFSTGSKDFITQVDEHSLILVQEISEDKGYEDCLSTARMICDMLGSEAMSSVRVAYGTFANDIQQVSRCYKEARLALNVGKIFYSQHYIHAYNTLGIGRLIYQLPINLCEMFMKEVFTQQKPENFDEETIVTINKFFENNLNVSETARQLFVHRNTLVYRLEKLAKSSGLDIRNFEDALTFKIALMVNGYMKYMEENGRV